MTLKQKKLERGTLVSQMRELTDKATIEERDLSEEETSSYDACQRDFDRLTNEIEREEKLLAMESALKSEPNNHAPAPSRDTQATKSLSEDKSRIYSDAFFTYARRGREGMAAGPNGGQYVNALQVGTDSEGGFLVPEEWERSLIKELPEISVIRKYAKVITSSVDKNIPVRSSRATFSWIDEEGAYSKVDPSYGNIVLGAHKLGGITLVSEELLQDNAYNLEAELRKDVNEEFAQKEEDAFLNGTGNKPQGLFQVASVAGRNVIGRTAASQTAITYDEIIDTVYTLKRKYRRNAVFIMSDDTVKKVRKLKDNDGQYIWRDGDRDGEPARLLGYPVEVSDSAPNAAAGARSIIFGDMGYYTIVDRLGMTMQRLNELYAENGQIGFKATRRLDGKLTISDAITFLQQAS